MTSVERTRPGLWLQWASFWDGYDRTTLRIGLCLAAGLELLVECSQVAWQSRDLAHYRKGGALAGALVQVPGAAWILFGLIAIGLAHVAVDRRPVLAGLWTLLWAAVLSEWQTQIFGSPSRNAFFPGAALLGWVLGQAWARELDRGAGGSSRANRERIGEAGALACIAAAYVGSCASKLVATGGAWADGMQVRALIVRQQPLVQWPILLDWRDAIIDSPALAAASATATLVIEGGAFLLLFGPRLRATWAVALIGLHTSILLLCTMPYLEPMVLLGLLALPWPQLTRKRRILDDAEFDSTGLPWRMLAVLTGLVALAWLLAPWGWRG